MKKKIPRVLIISEFYFNENSGGGVLLKNLFEKYPKDKLFILHEDINANTNATLNSYLLKKPSKIGNFLKKFLHPFFITLLIEFKNSYTIKQKEKVNINLLTKLKQFRPDVIYTIFGNYNLMCLIKQLKMKLKIPLITHVMDNVLATYNNKPKDYGLFKYLIDSSKIRIAINTKMSDEYRKIFWI